MKPKSKNSPVVKTKTKTTASVEPASGSAANVAPVLQVVPAPVIDPAAPIKQAYAGNDDAAALQLGLEFLAQNPDHKDVQKIVARVHNRQKNWPAAFDAWARLCTLEPRNPEPPLQMTRIALRSKDWSAALTHAHQVLQIDAAHEEALTSCLTCHVNQTAWLQAAAVAKQLLALKNTATQVAILKLATTMFEKVNLVEDALELAALLSATHSDNADAAKLRARILANLQTDAIAAHLEGDTDAAAKACRGLLRTYPQHERAITIMRDLVRPLLLRARAQLKAQETEPAIESYLAVLAMDPYHVETMKTLARTYSKNKNDAAAVEYWNKLTTLTPDDPEPALQLARIHVRTGNNEAAYVLYNKLLTAKGPAAEEAQNILDRLAQRLRRHATTKARELSIDEALRLHTLLAAKSPATEGLDELLDLIGRLSAREAAHAFKAADFASAVLHAQRAALVKPDDNRSLMVLARAAHKTQDYRAALFAWQQLHHLQPDQVEPLLQMARYHRRFRENDQTIKVCEALLALEPAHEEGQLLLQTVKDSMMAAV